MQRNESTDSVLLRRDSFVRGEYHRYLIPPIDRRCPCANCGQPRAKFQYGFVPDDAPRRARWTRPMCSIECARAFGEDA